MIKDERGDIEYEECGRGPTIVLTPGSCSTGAAWRPVITTWNGQFRCVTTSLLGYGRTIERRTAHDTSISHEVDVLELVIRKAGGPVHLVGHSFDGLVALALAVALADRVPLASLVILEAPVMELLREKGEHRHYRAFRRMTEGYFADFADGNTEAIAAMIDFYGGAGTFASWLPRVSAYAIKTTAVNILDWESGYSFPLPPAVLAALGVPTLIVRGGASHPAAYRANTLLGETMRRVVTATIDGAAHFMISTHADKVGQLIAEHLHRVEMGR
ncbi:MAG: alpha/beta hydrolase [Pseudolabrys sp.]|jgi:pimeloyl-ACP methyl ester carboxylesterase